MGIKRSRLDIWKSGGFTMTNPRWSWCGVNHEKRQVVFQVWVDHRHPADKTKYQLFSMTWGNTSSPGFADAMNHLAFLKWKSYQLVVMFAEAVDKDEIPRKTKWHGQELRQAHWIEGDGELWCWL